MVINSTLTVQLDILHAPIPLSRTRPRSVPVHISRSPTGSPSPSHLARKKRPRRKKLVEEKPPFVNFASANINPYRPLSPIPSAVCPRRSRSKLKSSKRNHRKQVVSADLLRTPSAESFSPRKPLVHYEPADVTPASKTAFSREFCRKRQIVIDNGFYRETVNTWRATSFNHLVTLMSEFLREDYVLDRLWIIYYWISQNIRYDLDADIHRQQQRHPQAEDVFRATKTSAQGYASIFKALCDCLKIPCEKIDGYAKDYSFKVDQPIFAHPNHAWNAVRIDQQWYLIDSAWGTGYIDGNHEYKNDLKTYYFLACPEQLIYNHLPENSRWQLLNKPISMADYLHLPNIHCYYFIMGLTLISPNFCSQLTYDPNQHYAEVCLQAPEDVQIFCSVKNDLRSTTLAQYDVNRRRWQCLFAPHKIGFHTLIVYATSLQTNNVFKNVLEFGLDVPTRDAVRRRTLPITFEKFLEHKCQIFSPLNGVLQHGTKATIRCRIPQAISARIALDGVWMDEVTMRNDLFKQEINVPAREVIVYARFRHQKSKIYDGLIRYLVEK